MERAACIDIARLAIRLAILADPLSKGVIKQQKGVTHLVWDTLFGAHYFARIILHALFGYIILHTLFWAHYSGHIIFAH